MSRSTVVFLLGAVGRILVLGVLALALWTLWTAVCPDAPGWVDAGAIGLIFAATYVIGDEWRTRLL